MNFKLAIFLFFGTFPLLQLAGAQDIAKVFSVTTKGNRCSGTLLKLDGKCHLVTNAHCISTNSKIKIAVPFTNIDNTLGLFPFEFVDLEFPSKLLKIDKQSDLASLSIPKVIEEKYCSKMDNTIANPDDLIDGLSTVQKGRLFLASGYVQGKLKHTFSGSKDWTSHAIYKFSPTFPVFTGLANLEYLVEIWDLEIYPGMSGGAIVNLDNKVVGIITRYAPFTEVAYIISIKSVEDFLNRPTLANQNLLTTKVITANHQILTGENSHADSGENSHADSGENSHADSGENSHADSGENSHADSGENSHADSGENIQYNKVYPTIDQRFSSHHALELFREPNEGIVNPENKNELILGYGPNSIDGADDYLIASKRTGKLDPKMMVTRPLDNLPTLAIRKKIIDRFHGHYNNLGAEVEKNKRLIYASDANHIQGFSKLLNGPQLFTIRIDKKKKTFLLSNGTHPLYDNNERIVQQVPHEELLFQISENPDFTKVFITNEIYQFVCENKHYLKLICLDVKNNAQMSFALNDSEGIGYHSFRWSRYLPDQKVVDFRFSIEGIRRSTEFKKWERR